VLTSSTAAAVGSVAAFRASLHAASSAISGHSRAPGASGSMYMVPAELYLNQKKETLIIDHNALQKLLRIDQCGDSLKDLQDGKGKAGSVPAGLACRNVHESGAAIVLDAE
jgi:hypothetical protein